MACDTSVSRSDLSEKSDAFIQSEVDSENEDGTVDALWQGWTKKLPVRYVDAFQSNNDMLEVEMNDSKYFDFVNTN